MKMNYKDDKTIPVFFSSDDNYLPFLAVSIRSLIDNLSPSRNCHIHILNNGLKDASVRRVLDMATDRVKISLVDVSREIAPLAEKLDLRDYYTISIYFRLFIASLFPQYHRAIYLDADIVVNGDITELYEMPIGNRLVGAIPDAVIASCEAFQNYATLGVGIPYKRYFNSGVMLMNLDQFRVQQIEKKFVYLLNTYHFETVCPDQDYLNILCRDQVLYLDKSWNKMAIDDRYDGVPNLIHYNNFFKPWQHDNICYKDYFWNYAERTTFYDEICAIREECRKHIDALHRKGMKNLHRSVEHIIAGKDNFRRVLARESIPDYIAAEAVYEA